MVIGSAFAVGLVLVLLTSRSGPLLDADSAAYLSEASLIREGPSAWAAGDPDQPLVSEDRFPVGYPFALALTGAEAQPTVAQVAPTALAVAALAALSAWVALRVGGPWRAAAAVVGVLAMRGTVARLGASVMSDGLALALGLSAIVLAAHARSRPARGATLGCWAIAAGLAAAATTVRWTGVVATIVVLGLAIAPATALRPSTASTRTAPRRRPPAAVVGSIAALALAPPVVASLVQAGSSVAQVGWRPLGTSDGTTFLDTVATLYGPSTQGAHVAVRSVVLLAAGVTTLLALAWSVRAATSVRPASDRATGALPPALLTPLVAYAWLHLGIVLASRAVLDPLIVFEHRHLLPWAVPLLIAAISSVHLQPGTPRALGLLAVALVLCSGTVLLARTVIDVRTSWFDLGVEARSSPVATAALTNDPDAQVATNRPDVIVLAGGTSPRSLPAPRDAETLDPRPAYLAEIGELADALAAEGVVVAVFETGPPWELTPEEAVEAFPGRTVEHLGDGVLIR